jgi:pyruvate/2-oxoglutarate dehydrogenase complex dihydrolipoamide dehydrogenase (E3) component
MDKQYDMLVIGLGPAGMALSAMGSTMGLNVLAIEKHKIGGECLNCGCIPSKALLKTALVRKTVQEIERYGLTKTDVPAPHKPFERVQCHLKYINEEKTVKMFDKVDLLMEKSARFLDSKTVEVDGKPYTARRIYICTGTRPMVPPIPGLDTVDYLTNETLFHLEDLPESLFIIGGGAIGCEMTQAFLRLGTHVITVHLDPHLIPLADEEAARVLEEELRKDGAEIHNATGIQSVKQEGDRIVVTTDNSEFRVEKLLVAAGRKVALEGLGLDNAGVRYDKTGILTDDYGQTNVPNIWAVGDCNGKALFSHAAMHQGMLSLMSSVMPLLKPFKFKYSHYPVPWSVFTDPEVAQVGLTEKQLQEQGRKYEVVKANYADYGRTITEEKTVGFVKVMVSPWGKIYGASIVGEAASELIHEFILAMHKHIRLHDIMLMQHSFPTISLLNKRVAEQWMMKKMQNARLQKLLQGFYRFFAPK